MKRQLMYRVTSLLSPFLLLFTVVGQQLVLAETHRSDVAFNLTSQHQDLTRNLPTADFFATVTPATDIPATRIPANSPSNSTTNGSVSVMDSLVDSLQQTMNVEQPGTNVSTPPVTPASTPSSSSSTSSALPSWESWTSPEHLSGNLRLVLVMAALSLAPALLLMSTCYVRIIVVLSLLRQALGSQQLPPNQVTTALAMFLTALIMWPVWSKVHTDAIEPYTNPDTKMTAEDAWTAGVKPVREFMSHQIHHSGNRDDVLLFLDYLPPQEKPVESYADVPLQALLPAFLLSELKVAFSIGFRVYLPFVIIDLVVSSITMALGWVMVPPSTISLPLKLIMFVLVDGWHLVVEMLLMSFKVAG